MHVSGFEIFAIILPLIPSSEYTIFSEIPERAMGIPGADEFWGIRKGLRLSIDAQPALFEYNENNSFRNQSTINQYHSIVA